MHRSATNGTRIQRIGHVVAIRALVQRPNGDPRPDRPGCPPAARNLPGAKNPPAPKKLSRFRAVSKAGTGTFLRTLVLPTLLAALTTASSVYGQAISESAPASVDETPSSENGPSSLASPKQTVRYEMDVTLHPDRHVLEGFQRLTYHNHSPDTLRRVYYHLYFNAFHPHSMMAERNRHLPDPDPRVVPRIFNLGPDETGFHEIRSLTQDGTPVRHSIFDTVMDVTLAEPIPPGGQAVFDLDFHAQVPLQTRRNGRDNREGIDYSMSQWYPKMAHYDERRWHADPYVGREFYAPFGTFDVRIRLPAEYVLGATGVLQNPLAMEADSIATETDSLTWHFRAENVHDFAWAADPDYIHDVLETDEGTTIHLLYQPDVAEVWEKLHAWAPEIMAFFGRKYGPYLYEQMTIAQAGDGGMEYPMITFVTGRRSPTSLLGVTAHEVAHMWFYGMMASNEADYAWMDEGFTSWATREVTAHIQANPAPSHVPAFLSVLQFRHLGLFETLNTPSDWFDTNSGYGVASYLGGEVILDMLGYVLSDSLRDRFLLEYHRQFAFRHPDPHDLERVAEEVSGIRLDWYFHQFGYGEWDLDYELGRLRSVREGHAWRTSVTLERNGRTVLPVDLRITLEDGSTQWVHVPLSIMQGSKPVPDDWIIAEPWAWTSMDYSFDILLPARARGGRDRSPTEDARIEPPRQLGFVPAPDPLSAGA